MGEQSHRDEMNAAIRAQRERQAAARHGADPAPTPAPPAIPAKKSLLARLLGR